MSNPLSVTLQAAAAETASGAGAAVDIGAGRIAVRLELDVIEVAGTDPELTLSLETSADGLAGWKPIGAFDVTSAISRAERTFGECQRFVRLAWTITGTDSPSFTFSVAGEAHQLYVKPSNLGRYSIRPEAIAEIEAHVLWDACLRATDEAAAALSSQYTMPITAWGEDLRGKCADLATRFAIGHRGFSPDGGDELIVQGAEAASSWLTKVARGILTPPGIIDSTPETYEGGAVVVSSPSRGW